MSLVVTQDSALLPVSLTTALRHLRVTQDDADLVQLYLQVAVAHVEDYTGRVMQQKSYLLSRDQWPTYWTRFRYPATMLSIELRRSPLVSIDSVKYYTGGALTTWDPANYTADTKSTPGRLVIKDGVSLPDLDTRLDALQIAFTSGDGVLESAISARMKFCVLTIARHFYDNRVPVVDAKMVELPLSFQFMMRSIKIDALTSET